MVHGAFNMNTTKIDLFYCQVTTSVLSLLKYHQWFKFTIVAQKTDQWITIAEDLKRQVSIREEFTVSQGGMATAPTRKREGRHAVNIYNRHPVEMFRGKRAYQLVMINLKQSIKILQFFMVLCSFTLLI